MATVLLKNSFTTASVPAGLSAGEMAVNVADKKLFVGNAVGGVVTLIDPNALVTSVNGLTGAVQGVSSVNGITGAVSLPASAFTQVLLSTEGGIQSSDANIYAGGTADTLTIKAGPGILLTGNAGSDSFTITNLAANAFLSIGFAATGAGVIEGVPLIQADLAQDTLTIQSGTGIKIVVDFDSDRYSIFNTGVLSFNGATGAVTGITAGGANTFTQLNTFSAGISASGATFSGNISAPNIVSSFNGLTGAVTGITAGGANTFTALNTFSAGISASGATFSGNVNLQDNVLSRVELLDYFERYVDSGNFTDKGNTIPIDLSTGQVFRVRLTVTGSSGLTVSNVPDNGNANAVGFTLLFVGDGTARVMTWNIGGTAVTWAGGTAPTYTSTNNKTDVFSFLTRDGGTTWFGFVGGQSF